MIFNEIIILGCGASGSIATIEAAKRYEKVITIDCQNKPAKKLLVTGNGRCNLTNKNTTSRQYNQNIDHFLSRFTPSQTLKYFSNLGLETYQDEEGRVYPLSNSAKSVTDVLTTSLSKSNISIYLDTKVISIEKQNDHFIISTNSEIFSCNKLVVATGGQTFLDFAQTLNINISPSIPSLVALKTESTKNLANIRLSNVQIKATNVFGQTAEEYGEILFKESGLSGIAIFNISTLFARSKNFSGTLSINLLPSWSNRKIIEMLTKRKELDIPISKFFEGLFVNQIGYEILNRCKLDETRPVSSLSQKEIENFANLITNLSFKVKGFYENNQVYSGGIKLSELTENLGSKKVEGLYFCGEICDVDGLCGGYNLQWAWTSGKIVSENI